MNLHLEYLTDLNGTPKAVVIPQKEWLKFLSDYEKLKKKIEILTGLTNALNEVKQIKNGKSKAKTLRSFLDEI